MPFVTVKNKFQVVIPAKVRERIGIKIGDLLEAKAERGKITFTPKSVIDRGLAESLEDFKQGRSYGPFDTAEEMIDALHRMARRSERAKKSRRSAR